MRKLWLIIPLVLVAAVWLYGCDKVPVEPESAVVESTTSSTPSYAKGGKPKPPVLPTDCTGGQTITWDATDGEFVCTDTGAAGAVSVLTVAEDVDLTPLWTGEKILSCPAEYTSISSGWILISPNIDLAREYLYQGYRFKVLDSWKWLFKNHSTTLTFRVQLNVYCLPKAS